MADKSKALALQARARSLGLTTRDIDRFERIITMVGDQWGPLAFDGLPALDQEAIRVYVHMGTIEVRLHQRLYLPGSMFYLDVEVEGTGFDIIEGVRPSTDMIDTSVPTITEHYAGKKQWMTKIRCYPDKPTEWRLTKRFVGYADQVFDNPTRDDSRHINKLVADSQQSRNVRMEVIDKTEFSQAEPTSNEQLNASNENSPKRKDKWLANAMLHLRDHPDWSDRKIAREVGKAPSTLSRSKEYKAAAAIARDGWNSRRRGFIKKDLDTGYTDIEAFADEDDSD